MYHIIVCGFVVNPDEDDKGYPWQPTRRISTTAAAADVEASWYSKSLLKV